MSEDEEDLYFWQTTLAARYAISWKTGHLLLIYALMGHAPSRDLIEWLVRKR